MFGYYNMEAPRKLRETDKPTTKQKRILRAYFGIGRASDERYIELRTRYNRQLPQIRQEYRDRQTIRNVVTDIFKNVRLTQAQESRARQVLRRGVRRLVDMRGSDTQLPTTNNIHEAYKRPLKNYLGQRVKIITFLNGDILFSRTLDIPAERFNRWWSDLGFREFMEDSQNSMIDRYDPNDIKIVITPNIELSENRITQLFAEGITNCMLTPILDWANETLTNCKSESAKKKYNAIINKINKYEKQYPNGIPEDKVQDIADNLQIDIYIDQPVSNKQFIVCKSQKKSLRTFRFVNTRLNHIELNEVVNDDFVDISIDDLQILGKNLLEKDKYFDYKKDKDGRYTKIRTLQGKYQAVSEYNEVVNKFEKETGLINCKIDFLNDEVSYFIRNGVHYNGTIDFADPDEDIKHIDMYRAYASFWDCTHYDGFLGKITDYRKTDKIVDIGYYRVTEFDWSQVEKSKLKVFKKMNCYLDHNVYPSVELNWLKSHGVKFGIEEGCWGTRIDFSFNDDMLECKDRGTRFYAKWSGSQTSYSSYQSFYMKGTKEYFENMKAIVKTDCEVKCFEDGEGIIEYPKKHDFKLAHITGFITMYQRLTVFNQLFNMDYSKLIRVCVDGIYYNDHKFKMIDPFRVKDDINLKNLAGVGYCSGVYKYGKYRDEMNEEVECPYYICENDTREHYRRELFKGAGGNGKTHYNLMDKGLVRMCYVAPSYKLTTAKKNDYGCKTTVLARAIHDVHSLDIVKYYNVLIFDEVSQYSEEDKQKIFNTYRQHKLIFCGDIGYQLPCITGIPMNETSFNNVREFKQNYRFKCGKHKVICDEVRKMMDDDFSTQEINQFIINSYENVKEPVGYNPNDIILCSRHEHCDEWTKKYGETKWCCKTNSRDYSNGDIVIGENPKVGTWEARHGYTIHSVQGETYENTIFIDSRNLFSATMGYTAISRARRWDQVKIISC